MTYKITLSTYSTYKIDTARVLRDFPEFAEEVKAYGGDVKKAIECGDMFNELCGVHANGDHVDGLYIWLDDIDYTIVDVQEVKP